MERPRPPHALPAPTSAEVAAPVALSWLREKVSAPGAERKDVDALLAGLERPLADDESPRERADFLLSLLNSRHLCSMKGRKGRSVQAAAVGGLMELGHPYALEIPPEALDRVDREAFAAQGRGERDIPVLGILLSILGAVPTLVFLPLGLVLVVSVALALFGGAVESRGLQKAGVGLMGLLSAGLFLLGGVLILEDLRSHNDLYDGLTKMLGLFALGPALFLGLGAFLLRHPAWRAEEED
ncbi:hypothetical protein [Stigmatella erecta]|uniref:Uncharacterized protein n=1 Tax=Stigmatella erecta TaxID=83460 RepID=A0A1I0IKL4_9BACT|nr:hypothetical protein [Stigmatella erecta]SET97496.1 hypothetical protein SAMN05443639_106120 [Stigmatella erecta]